MLRLARPATSRHAKSSKTWPFRATGNPALDSQTHSWPCRLCTQPFNLAFNILFNPDVPASREPLEPFGPRGFFVPQTHENTLRSHPLAVSRCSERLRKPILFSIALHALPGSFHEPR